MILPATDCKTCKELCEAHAKSNGLTFFSFWELMRHVVATGHELKFITQELDPEQIRERFLKLVKE